MTKPTQKRRGPKSKEKGLCLACGRAQESSRGLCSPCYSSARRLVSLGKKTWDELIESGLAKPKRASRADIFMGL